MRIQNVGVAGFDKAAGIIVQVIAGGGFPVIAWQKDESGLEKSKKELSEALGNAINSGFITKEEKEDILNKITFTSDMTSLKDADVVIESAVEDVEIKKGIFSELSGLIREDAVLATNTSCFSATEIAGSAGNPQRCLGLHFLESVRGTKFVEIVRTENSSEETISLAVEFCSELNIECVVVKDSPGFLVNYLFVPYMNRALEAYDQGLADKEDLDTAIRMGLGYPKGPLELIDKIGLDKHLHLTGQLYRRINDPRFSAPSILNRKVEGGKLGIKTGEGFHSYK
ncbi:MAG: 3-hydroxyacyl-CoA dehydrogenase family protein [Desulfobacteraceae bacterium]|nr:3-hydroxyacyl-CoA dehydrogenase family protein [Desulfobacteraceae bacterium]